MTDEQYRRLRELHELEWEGALCTSDFAELRELENLEEETFILEHLERVA